MGLTNNGRLLISHMLGGGIGYYPTQTYKLINMGGTEGYPINSVFNYIAYNSSGSGDSYGMHVYIAYGTKPADVQTISSSSADIFYVANTTTDTVKTKAQLQEGSNIRPITITNPSTTDTKTYYGYGMVIACNGYPVDNTNGHIISYYDFSTPITLQPGESKTIDLEFNFANV